MKLLRARVSNGRRDADPNTYRLAYTYSYGDCYGYSHCHRYTYSYSDINANSYCHGYSHCNGHGHTYSYANGYCKCYSYMHAQTVANGAAWTIDQAASNPGAAAVAW